MKRWGYLEKLSLAARWFLPREEAEGVISDYRDILLEVEGPEEALKRFGPPVKLVRGLAEPKKVRKWHYFFAMLLFLMISPCLLYFFCYRRGILYYELSDLFLCGAMFFAALWVVLAGSYQKRAVVLLTLLLAGFMGFVYSCGPTRALTNLYNRLAGWHQPLRIGLPWGYEVNFFFFAAALIMLLLFGLGSRPKQRMPGFLTVSLCLAAWGVAVVCGFCLYGFYVDMGLLLHLGWVKAGSLCAGGLCFAGALFSIVMARLWDRRWRAVGILCLTGLAMCMGLQELVWNWSPCLWQLVRDYEAGMATAVAVEPLAFQAPLYFGIGAVLAALGLR